MSGMFSSYEILPVDDLIRNNISPDHTQEDLNSLLNILAPIRFLAQNTNTRSPIHSDMIRRFESKAGLLDLLKLFGYDRNYRDEWVFFDESDSALIDRRRRAVEEFNEFFQELRKARNSPQGIESFLASSPVTRRRFDEPFNRRFENARISPQRRPPSDDEHDHSGLSSRSSSQSHIERGSTPVLPDARHVQEGNEKNLDLIRLFKEDVFARQEYGPPSTGFVRRKIAVLLYQQLHPELNELDPETIDDQLSASIRDLKNRDTSTNTSREDEIYVECLLRTHFQTQDALNLLTRHRPNLKAPVEIPRPSGQQYETSLQQVMPHLQTQAIALHEYHEDDGAVPMLLHAEDNWKNCVHIIPSIRRLRLQYQGEASRNILFSKIYRLLYSEINANIQLQSPVKIELFTDALLEIPDDALEHVDMADIKDILCSCGDDEVDERFRESAIKSLAQECPICGGTYPRSRMEPFFLCDHKCCVDCTKTYYRGAIKDVRDSQTLPVLTCYEKHPIPTDSETQGDFLNYLERKFNRWFRDEKLLLETYYENLFIATHPPNVVKCSNPKCRASFVIDDNRGRCRTGVQCPYCQFRQCLSCSQKWYDDHREIPCETYEDWLVENDPENPEVQLMKYLQTAGMMCPNPLCQNIFEYQAGGCEHFTCRQCQTEFCRVCSSLFYDPKKKRVCPQATCSLKTTIHAHCAYNCYREIRDAEPEEILDLLNNHNVDVDTEFQSKPVATGPVCPVDGCDKAASAQRENRFCETCYKQFLCLLIWRNQIEPWILYSENQLRVKLGKEGIQAANDANKDQLVGLSRMHLAKYLGKPKKLPRMRK